MTRAAVSSSQASENAQPSHDADRVEPFLQLRPVEQRARGELLDPNGGVDEGADDRGRVSRLEEPVAGLVATARRRGVEDDCAADGGLAPQDDAVPARGEDGRREA